MAPVLKVLVFESDPSFADALRAGFGKLGCAVRVVEDGNAGLQVATADRPDLILLSLELENTDGFSLCNKLKRDAASRDVPVVILSSRATDDTFGAHQKLRTRAQDYLHKPIAFADLLARVRQLVTLEAPEAEEAFEVEEEDWEVMTRARTFNNLQTVIDQAVAQTAASVPPSAAA